MTMTAPLHPETDGLCDPVSLGDRADPAERWYVGVRCRLAIVSWWSRDPRCVPSWREPTIRFGASAGGVQEAQRES